MDRRAQLKQALKSLQEAPPIQVWPAIVKSVEGTNCTVDLVGTDLTDISEVNLRADDEATEGVLYIPKVGSYVYVSAVENAVDNLFVCLVSEVDRIEVKIGKTSLTVDKEQVKAIRDKCELTLTDKAILTQDQATLELSGGKVKVTNGTVNLKDVLTDLTGLLKTFQVVCANPGAPSASVFPATLTQITQIETKVNQLLQ